MNDYPDQDIVFIDADAIVRQEPVLFDELSERREHDVAVHYHPVNRANKELLSGTLWLANTARVAKLIDVWHKTAIDNVHVRHQRCLDMAIREMNAAGKDIRVFTLPREYTLIYDYYRRERPRPEPVVEHFQASRKYRYTMGGKAKKRTVQRASRSIPVWPSRSKTRLEAVDAGRPKIHAGRRAAIHDEGPVERVHSASGVTFSVIIPAYKATAFIGECLGSIVEQRRFQDFDDFEILLGIDGCEETRAKVEEIKHAYKNLKVFWFPENHGPYVVRNTLVQQSRGDYLIFFDADDVALSGLIDYCERQYHKPALSSFRYYIYGDMLKSGVSCGVFGIRRKDFDSLGGFMPWECAADTEFRWRAKRYGIQTPVSMRALFYRRRHAGCLTRRKDTGKGSPLRKQYSRMILNRSIRTKKVPVKTAPCEVMA